MKRAGSIFPAGARDKYSGNPWKMRISRPCDLQGFLRGRLVALGRGGQARPDREPQRLGLLDGDRAPAPRAGGSDRGADAELGALLEPALGLGRGAGGAPVGEE